MLFGFLEKRMQETSLTNDKVKRVLIVPNKTVR